jgi:UDP:flavonoid glycosyltransferase YjiC (YdhE family)
LSDGSHQTHRSARPRFIFDGVAPVNEVMPMLELASELSSRGYACHLLTSGKLASEARARGIESSVIDAPSCAGRERLGAARTQFTSLRAVADFFLRGRERTSAGTVVVNLDRRAASNLLCERNGLRTVRLHLAPCKIRSRIAPSWPYRANVSGLLAETYRRCKLPALYAQLDGDPDVLGQINRERDWLDLAPVSSATYPEPYVKHQLALFPRWYGQPAADWPDLHFAGFPLAEARAELPDVVEDAAWSGPPVVFDLPAVAAGAEALYAAAERCLEELGLPGVVARQDGPARRLGARLFAVSDAELRAFVPHAALVVHTGEMAGVARALAAGVPQIIVPAGGDQPDNAERVAALGVGKHLVRATLSGEALWRTARELLAQPGLAARLDELRAQIVPERAIKDAASSIEARFAAPPQAAIVERAPKSAVRVRPRLFEGRKTSWQLLHAH